MTKSEAGRLGGLATVNKHGVEHMRKIGKRGYTVTRSKYQVLPYKLTEWCMVNRETGEIVSTWR